MAYGIGLLFWLWSRDMAVHRVMAMAYGYGVGLLHR